MLVAAAMVPVAPLLVPEIAGGSAAADDALRAACHEAVAHLVEADLDEIVVVGPASKDGPVEGSWDWRGFGVASPPMAPAQRLPHGLAIGCWLLDAVGGPTPPRRFFAVSPTRTPLECAGLGHDLVAGATRIGLLVCGDGTACRSEKAPGFLDPSAAAWDDAALVALASGDPHALLALDAAAGTRLMAAGRAPWQLLAGAADGGAFEARIDWAEAPYGVLYVVGSWLRISATAASGP